MPRANMGHAGGDGPGRACAGRVRAGRSPRRHPRHHCAGVGPHRLHRLRRATDAHRHAARSDGGAPGLARPDGIRGRHRGHQHSARPRLDAARHLLRLAPPRGARRTRGRRLLHLPRAGRHHRPGGRVPPLASTPLGGGRRTRRGSGGRTRRRVRRARD